MNDNLIGHGPIDYIFVFGMIIFAYWAGQTKPQRILYILPACLSCFYFIEIGRRLTADKLVPMVFVMSVILSKGVNYFNLPKRNVNSWIGKVWLLLFLGIVIGFIYKSYYSEHVTSIHLNTRLIIQLIGYLNLIILVDVLSPKMV